MRLDELKEIALKRAKYVSPDPGETEVLWHALDELLSYLVCRECRAIHLAPCDYE